MGDVISSFCSHPCERCGKVISIMQQKCEACSFSSFLEMNGFGSMESVASEEVPEWLANPLIDPQEEEKKKADERKLKEWNEILATQAIIAERKYPGETWWCTKEVRKNSRCVGGPYGTKCRCQAYRFESRVVDSHSPTSPTVEEEEKKEVEYMQILKRKHAWFSEKMQQKRNCADTYRCWLDSTRTVRATLICKSKERGEKLMEVYPDSIYVGQVQVERNLPKSAAVRYLHKQVGLQ